MGAETQLQTFDIRCHSCGQWIGEHPRALKLMAVLRAARERDMVPLPRVSHRCKGCGWLNVFREVDTSNGNT